MMAPVMRPADARCAEDPCLRRARFGGTGISAAHRHADGSAGDAASIAAASGQGATEMNTIPAVPARTVKKRPVRPADVRRPPAPLKGGPLAFWRFARSHHMMHRGYIPLIARWAWLKLRFRGRLQTDGLCFICPGVTFEIGPNAVVTLGRWSWLGHGCKVRAHEGTVSIGAKSVLGQECTISSYQHVSIGRECIVADRVMLIDFDHGMVETERPIRNQGIYMRDVNVGHNVWIGYGACILRGVTVGHNSVVGTNAVVTKDVPDNAVVGGVPAKLIRMRDAPETFVWVD
jgi:acetyltransferase-like isoleucine patch superfamily enzyme